MSDIKQYRIFNLYDISELSRRTGYSEGHLVNVKRGTMAASPRFRRMCALSLQKREDELFDESDAATIQQ